MRRVLVFACVSIAITIATVMCACDAVIGLGDYKFDASSANDAANDTMTSSDGSNCDVDLSKECFRCQPQTNEQFLNACSNGAVCTGFQDLKGLLLPDGGLPSLPPADGGPG